MVALRNMRARSRCNSTVFLHKHEEIKRKIGRFICKDYIKTDRKIYGWINERERKNESER